MKSPLSKIGRETQTRLRRYLQGLCPRSELAEWAVQQLLAGSNADFQGSDYGRLLEYVLCCLTDDDWTTDQEFREEIEDLLTRLEEAQAGFVRLP